MKPADMEQQRTPVDIDDDVEWLTEQIQALKHLGQQDNVSDSEVYDLSIRWGTALAGRLPRLVHYSSRGLLEESDERRFQALCDQMRELSGLIDRIGFVQPEFNVAAVRRREPKRATSRRGLRFRRG